MFSWLKKLKPDPNPPKPFPPAWLGHLHSNVRAYAWLTDAEQEKLRAEVQVLIARKYWEGCGGVTITDEIKVTIAAQACLLLLGLEEHGYFGNVRSILVYPTAYRVHEHWVGPDRIVHEGSTERAGEAWYRGPVILGWDAVRAGGRNYQDGRNVVLHEFAHQLDFLDGWIDGTPPLENREQFAKWCEVMTAEYDRLIADSKEGRATLLDQYGATNPGEFFAVTTECFFERPIQLQERHPLLYEVLQEYYGQDPAARFARKRGR